MYSSFFSPKNRFLFCLPQKCKHIIYQQLNSLLYFTVVAATSSSVYFNPTYPWLAYHMQEPKYAIDGWVSPASEMDNRTFMSNYEIHPWFQLEFEAPMVVQGVTYTNAKVCCGEYFRNYSIFVGDQPAVVGANGTHTLVNNPVCAHFVGPSATGRTEHIMCTKPLVGRYLQVQHNGYPNEKIQLQINEIEVSFGNSSTLQE
jgi:hypothetical protein